MLVRKISCLPCSLKKELPEYNFVFIKIAPKQPLRTYAKYISEYKKTAKSFKLYLGIYVFCIGGRIVLERFL